MGKFVVKDAKIYLGGYDLTGDMNQAELASGADAVEKTVFGDDARNYMPGLLTSVFSAAGFWEAANPDAVFQANIGGANDVLIVGAGGSAGDIAYMMKTTLSEYKFGGSVGDAAGFDVAAGARDAAVRGEIAAVQTITSAGNSAAVQLGALTSSQRIWAAAMTTGAPTGISQTLNLTLESDNSAGFGSPTPRASFAQMSSRSQEMLSADGAIADDYWRLAWTVGGTSPSFPIAAAFGIVTI